MTRKGSSSIRVMPETGEHVGGYAFIREIGRGTTSLILEVQSAAGEHQAMKLLVTGLAAEPATRERFQRGIRAQREAAGTGVAPVLDSGTDPERGPWLTMPLYSRGSLAERIREGGMTPAALVEILGPVAEGLDRAHHKGVVHRDIKPSNVLIGSEGRGALADFGLARGEGDQSQTMAGTVVGTLSCVSPEVVQGGEATAASDRYGFAAILVEGLTGQTVFPRSSDAAVLYAHAQLPPPSLSERRESLPAGLDPLFELALSKDPAGRPDTCGELLEEVRKQFGDGLDSAPGLDARRSPAVDEPTMDPTGPNDTPGLDRGGDPGDSPGEARRLVSQGERSMPRHRSRRVLLGAGATVLVAVLAAFLILRGGDPDSTSSAAPPVSDGMVALGSELPAGDVKSVDCRGKEAGANSPSCTVMQTALPGGRLLVPSKGAIRAWSVRGAVGELALQVIRERDGEFFQMFRSQITLIPDHGVHTFPVELAVDAGDRLALAVSPDTEVGVVPDVPGARTDRFFGPVGPETRPDLGPGTGFDNEVLLRVEYEPGGIPEPPEQIVGEEAAGMDDGNVVAASETDLPDGRRVVVHLTEFDDQVWVDLIRGGTRQARIAVPDLEPGGQVVEFKAFSVPDSDSQLNVGWINPGMDRPIQHYFGLAANSLEFYS